jgi:adenine specific DNA methylase Mod
MKREEKERKEIEKNQEDKFSGSESDSSEYGIEYDFFITENFRYTKKKTNRYQPGKQRKGDETIDQSKTFFLPDFFSHED